MEGVVQDFAGAPLIDWLDGRPRLTGALAAITAAVVGVIANLSLWFAAHVVFATVGVVEAGPVRIIAPVPGSLVPAAVALAVLAAVLLIWARRPLPLVLALTAVAGWGLSLAGL